MQRINQYEWIKVQEPSGQVVYRIKDQVSGSNSGQRQKRYANFVCQSIVGGYLSGGTNQLQYIINGEMGQISRVWVQFTITVSNAPVQLLPAFMWIDRLYSYKDSTNSKGMDSNWASILFALGNLTPAQFGPLADAMFCDSRDAWSVEPFQVGTYNVYVPLYDACLITNSNLHYYPKNISVVVQSPLAGCVEIGNPANVQLTALSLLLEETLIPAGISQLITMSHQLPVQRIFLDWQRFAGQNVTITPSSVGAPINITLTGLEGVTPFLVYGLQNNTDNTVTNGAIKRFVKLGSAGSQAKVSLLTPAGAPIMNQAIDPYQQLQIAAESSYGSILDAAWSSLYFLEYTVDRIAAFNGVISAGWRKAENNEILQITPGNYTAEVPRVLTITTTDGTGAATVAVAGSYVLHYCNGYGATFVSPPIAYNASQADVQTAINNMQIYGGAIVTAGATNVNALGGLTITVTRFNAYDTAVQGGRWSVINSTLRTNAAALIPTMTDVGGSTVVGIPPGTYSPFILFPKFVILTINPDRTTYIRDVTADGVNALTLM